MYDAVEFRVVRLLPQTKKQPLGVSLSNLFSKNYDLLDPQTVESSAYCRGCGERIWRFTFPPPLSKQKGRWKTIRDHMGRCPNPSKVQLSHEVVAYKKQEPRRWFSGVTGCLIGAILAQAFAPTSPSESLVLALSLGVAGFLLAWKFWH